MSTRRPDGPALPRVAEELLTSWPAPERSEQAWDDLAQGTLARVGQTDPGSTDEALLAAPLPREPGEPDRIEPPGPTVTADEDLDENESLAAIARAAVAAQRESAADVVKEGLSHARQTRQPQPTGARPSRPEPPRAAPTPTADAAEAAPRPARSVPPPPARDGHRSRDRAVIWALSGALAAAAAALVYVSTRPSASEEAVALNQASARAPARQRDDEPIAAEPPPAEKAASAPLALDDLPEETADEAPRQGASATLSLERREMPASTTPRANAVAPQTEASKQDLGRALEERAGSGSPPAEKLRPASRKRALPKKPALGAVQAAIGARMSAARLCLAGQDDGAKVKVTFSSDGKVDQVAASHAAAGTPAESCLRGAFMSARVPAFEEPSFTASITVRPP